MSDSILTSILSILDKRGIGQIANHLGESEQSVSRGMESSIAVVLSSLAGKASEPGGLQQVFDLSSRVLGDIRWSHILGAVSDASSSVISGGKRLLSGLFGANEGAIINELGRQSGLRSGTASLLMSLATPLVLSNLGRRISSGETTTSKLGMALQREAPSFRDFLPGGLQDMFHVQSPAMTDVSSVVAQTVHKEQSGPSWLTVLSIGALIAGAFWFFTNVFRPTTAHIGPGVREAADRMARVPGELGDFVMRKLPNSVGLNIPMNGVEARLLDFIQDPNRMPDRTSSFDFDRLQFDTASSILQPGSDEQLGNIAAILNAYPNVRLKVCGYTDQVGSAEQNMKLSQDRADRVVNELVGKGVSRDRLTSEAFGERNAVDDNSTAEGRAKNRRVTLQVTQK